MDFTTFYFLFSSFFYFKRIFFCNFSNPNLGPQFLNVQNIGKVMSHRLQQRQNYTFKSSIGDFFWMAIHFSTLK